MDVLETMRSDQVVAVVRAPSVPRPAQIAEAFVLGGVRCVEFTFTIPTVLDAIRAASNTDARIGAGTVLQPEQAAAAIDAGAAFVVSPACRPALVEVCKDAGVPVFLGALTPTEVAAAVEAGTSAVKIFPARLGGPSYIKDLLGPYPDVAFIPSGGVSESNAPDFLAAGCPAVYAGSKLAPPELVASGETDEIARRTRSFIEAVRAHAPAPG